jgi:hypothetical protein
MLRIGAGTCRGQSRELVVKARLALAWMVLALPLAAQAQANDPMLAKLSAEKAGTLEPGEYSAGEGRDFSLTPYRGKYLLRFADSAESFVLTADPGSLGAKLLKYDTGAAALSVSVWGGLTLYDAAAPNGVPATRRGDAVTPSPSALSAADFKAALEDEASHFAYAGNVTLRFAIDAALLADADTRALAFDVLANTQAGLERFLAASPAAQKALARRVATVRLEKAGKAGLALNGRTLAVHFAPAEGFLGRPSSHAFAHQLGKLLSVNTAE